MKIGDVIMINIPHFAGNAVSKVKAHRAYNHRIARITAVEGDYFRLDIDEGKNTWPASILAVPVLR